MSILHRRHVRIGALSTLTALALLAALAVDIGGAGTLAALGIAAHEGHPVHLLTAAP
ncbi:hypothetical protein [Salinarimonas soli]|uniref:hypothetical protein n=1 Tax=Salinarimonas soli TaxID=1638099 RepID=UPI001661A859|nr:hypothetical protein [Salinarimonas soli]